MKRPKRSMKRPKKNGRCAYAVGHGGPCLEVYITPPETVRHPAHYTSHPSGVECLAITEHMNFCLGNAIKYIWRAGLKTIDPMNDLEKAKFYIEREILRLKKEKSNDDRARARKRRAGV